MGLTFLVERIAGKCRAGVESVDGDDSKVFWRRVGEHVTGDFFGVIGAGSA